MPLRLQHLHTYFLFPFSIDKQAVADAHPQIWHKHATWMMGLQEWFSREARGAGGALIARIGHWKRSAYTRFDIDSPAYQDMVFFHPYVRRVFFDSAECWGEGPERESLLHSYRIPLEEPGKLWFEAIDAKGRSACVEITELRLFVFANGIGILSIGVEAKDISAEHALWINEMMRKVYPSSSRQLREGRVPNRLAFHWEQDGKRQTLVEETFSDPRMIGFQPPLAKTIQSLLYFADYNDEEFEPVLDERMIVYSYSSLDPVTTGEDFITSERYRVFLSRLLYVDRSGEVYRYDPEFVGEEMHRQIYSRWAHQGTYYGFTSYSSVTASIGRFDCGEHELSEGFLVHRMFTTRYYLVALITLFYRVALLDFAERTALVSRRLYIDQQGARLTSGNLQLASELRSDFLHFSNYWYFDELANKDEENEHFVYQIREYRVDSMKREIEEEIDKLNESLHNYYQFRNTEAVNRLAMLSMILGAGAVITGFFGMNFGGWFGRTFFEPGAGNWTPHWVAISMVMLIAFGAVLFGFFVVISHWVDYRESLLPRWWLLRKSGQARSLRRG